MDVPVPVIESLHGKTVHHQQNVPEMSPAPGPVIVTKGITTETAHRLTNYKGKCAHIHGHSWRWEVVVEVSRPDARGISIDFGDLKKIMVENIEEVFDHALVLHTEDPIVRRCLRLGQDVSRFLGPADSQAGRVVIMDQNPTSENLAHWAQAHISHLIRTRFEGWGGKQIGMVTVVVHETGNSYCEV